MPVMMIAMLAAAGIQVAGSIIGHLIEQGKEKEAWAILEKARSEYGSITPETLQQSSMDVLGPTEMQKISVDPRFQQAQLESLDQTRAMQEGGGFLDEDRSNLHRVRQETARAASARNAQLREEMNARGIGGSGAELAMRLASNQAEAEQAGQAGLDISGQAQRRYFDAIRERARMAGQMRDQSFGEQAQVAAAQDRINQYNHGFQFDQHQYNQDIAQRNYNNKLGLADRKYGIQADRAADIRGQGQRDAKKVGDVSQNIGNAVYAGGSYAQGQGAGADPRTSAQTYKRPTDLPEYDPLDPYKHRR